MTTDSGIACTLTDLGEEAIYTGELILVNNWTDYHFPEDQELGWVLLSEHGADYSAYSHRLTYGTALPDDRVPIVQAEFREAECLLLDQHGYVHSNLYPVSGHRVTSLRNFQR